MARRDRFAAELWNGERLIGSEAPWPEEPVRVLAPMADRSYLAVWLNEAYPGWSARVAQRRQFLAEEGNSSIRELNLDLLEVCVTTRAQWQALVAHLAEELCLVQICPGIVFVLIGASGVVTVGDVVVDR